MKDFRNPSVQRVLVVMGGVTALLTIIGAVMGRAYAWFALIVGFVLTVALLYLTIRWLHAMRDLSNYVDRALHGESLLAIHDNREGELSILKNELYKLASALRQQRETAQEDKRRLADSLADISHQLKTPLTSQRILIRLLMGPELTDEARRTHAYELARLARRMSFLIQNLLKVSRLDAGCVTFVPQTTRIDAVIQQALLPLAIPLELREIRVELSGAPEDGMTVDCAWTAEALGNVIKNCMEHSPAGGVIRIRHEENALFSAIVIQDDGPGFSPADLPHLFERFYRGENAPEDSAGIGMNLARQIISMQNGVITAQNALPHGARFTIQFMKKIV